MNGTGRLRRRRGDSRRDRGAARAAPKARHVGEATVLQREIERLKKQIRAERVADRGGKAPADAVRLSALPIGDASHRDLGSGDGFALGVVGESHRQAALQELNAGRLKRGDEVTFVAEVTAEPENPYDPNAIRVSIQGGAHVGYLSRDDALRYRPVFQALAAQQVQGIARAKLIATA